MDMKKYAFGQLNKVLEDSRVISKRISKSLKLLDNLDLKKANYVVSFKSLWENEGGKSTHTEYTGSLEGAIAKAEEDFRVANNTPESTQARCFVQVRIGQLACPIPESYWKKYRSS